MRATWLGIFFCFKMATCDRFWYIMENRQDRMTTNVIYNMTSDIIKDCDQRIADMESVRLDNFRSASFEIGYLNYLIVEEYRKMVDKYNTTIYMTDQLYPTEVFLYLYEIETHFWQIKHLVNMQHEIERKYMIVSDLFGRPEHKAATQVTLDPNRKKTRPIRDKETRMLEQMLDTLEGTTRRKSTRWWWPIEYGWEIETYW